MFRIVCVALFVSGLSAYAQKPEFEIIIKEISFDHKTKDSIDNRGDKRIIDITVKEEGCIVYTYNFNEVSKRNCSVEFAKDKHSISFKGHTETDSVGARGNFEGTLQVIFVKPIKFQGTQAEKLELMASERIKNGKSGTFRTNDFTSLMADMAALHKEWQPTNSWLVEVDAANEDWHSSIAIEPGKYVISPDRSTRYRTAPTTRHNYYGIGDVISGPDWNIPTERCRLGSLCWAIFNVDPGSGNVLAQCGAAIEQLSYRFMIKHKAHVHFKIADKPGTYGDNSGKLKVLIIRQFSDSDD